MRPIPTAGCRIWCSRTTRAGPSSGARATWRICSICAGELNKPAERAGRHPRLSGYPIAVLENVDGTRRDRGRAGRQVGDAGGEQGVPARSAARAAACDLHIKYVDELRTALHDLAETPRTAFGEAGRAIAGAALQVELQPLVQKVKRKRRGLASLYRKRNAMLLDLMERFGGAPIGGLRRTVPVWPPILPSDREAEARVGVQLVNAKVRSRRSVAADLGEEDPDGEIDADRRGGAASGRAGGRRRQGSDEDGETAGRGRGRGSGAEAARRRGVATRGSRERTTPPNPAKPPDGNPMGDQVEAAIAAAMSKLGAPYVWATAGPDTFDCSGFTWWVACQVLGPQEYELRSSHHQFNVWGERGQRVAGSPATWCSSTRWASWSWATAAAHVGFDESMAAFIHAANEDLGVRIDRLRCRLVLAEVHRRAARSSRRRRRREGGEPERPAAGTERSSDRRPVRFGRADAVERAAARAPTGATSAAGQRELEEAARGARHSTCGCRPR